jgi:hypothetical protein
MWICKTCNIEGQENFYNSQRWYCKNCWNKKTTKRTKDNVKTLKDEFGGKCSICGYDKCMDALQFHHLDPTEKEYALGTRRQFNLDFLRKEMAKCVLVCANCHAEIHAKVLQE